MTNDERENDESMTNERMTKGLRHPFVIRSFVIDSSFEHSLFVIPRLRPITSRPRTLIFPTRPSR
jgi:hypothetical protein